MGLTRQHGRSWRKSRPRKIRPLPTGALRLALWFGVPSAFGAARRWSGQAAEAAPLADERRMNEIEIRLRIWSLARVGRGGEADVKQPLPRGHVARSPYQRGAQSVPASRAGRPRLRACLRELRRRLRPCGAIERDGAHRCGGSLAPFSYHAALTNAGLTRSPVALRTSGVNLSATKSPCDVGGRDGERGRGRERATTSARQWCSTTR